VAPKPSALRAAILAASIGGGRPETVTRVAETGVPDEAYQAARAVFEKRELVDLTIAIALMNAYNRMATSFRNTPQAALEK
jgi:hypothetical protein